jgi:hypothetical protein
MANIVTRFTERFGWGQWRFRCPLKSEASLSSLFQLSGGRLRDIT